MAAIASLPWCAFALPSPAFHQLPALPYTPRSWRGTLPHWPAPLFAVSDRTLGLLCPHPQVTFVGSDGRHYTFLAKPKDDLRKDNRMMEAAGERPHRAALRNAAQRELLSRDSSVPPELRTGVDEALPCLLHTHMQNPICARTHAHTLSWRHCSLSAGVINRLFAGDPAARRRNLYLRCALWWGLHAWGQCSRHRLPALHIPGRHKPAGHIVAELTCRAQDSLAARRPADCLLDMVG